jgi:hypothetical protein
VVQATPIGGPGDEIPVRVHHRGSKVEASERDHVGKWSSPPVDTHDVDEACLVIELKPNPWAPTPHPLIAPASHHPYVLSLNEAAVPNPEAKPGKK